MESGLIPDESISVSSLRDDYRPASARFNSFFRGWESDVTDFPQWIQVELNQDETLTHIATRGIAISGEINYVKSYKLYYRKAFAPFVVYTENGQPRVSCCPREPLNHFQMCWDRFPKYTSSCVTPTRPLFNGETTLNGVGRGEEAINVCNY
jgi:hypothetical protein